MFPNRTLCSILDELRTCFETRNFSYMISLIEEAQSAGNRMEASLLDKSDLDYARKELRKIKNEIKTLKGFKESMGIKEEE